MGSNPTPSARAKAKAKAKGAPEWVPLLLLRRVWVRNRAAAQRRLGGKMRGLRSKWSRSGDKSISQQRQRRCERIGGVRRRPTPSARALEHYVPRLFSFLSLGHRFHAVALATTTYHKRFPKSRDYLGLYDFKLITFYVGFSLLTAYQFLICRDSKSGKHFCSPLWCLCLRSAPMAQMWNFEFGIQNAELKSILPNS